MKYRAAQTIVSLKEGSVVNNPSHHLIQDSIWDDSKIELLDNLRSSFFKVYSLFLKEVKNRAFIDSFRAKLGDGQTVDLFNLYCIVRSRKGYGNVTQMGKWGSVALDFGLHYGTAASLKLIHFKYLNEFDLWLRDMCLGNDKLESFSMVIELELGFRSFFSDEILEETGKKLSLDVQCRLNCIPNIVDEDENCYIPKKRKLGNFHQMLEWLVDVAKRSDDPAIGIIPDTSKFPKHSSEELWVQALLVRDAMCRKKWQLCPENLSEKKTRMHPSMYEDSISGHPYSERLRCRGTHSTLVKSSSSTTLPRDIEVGLLGRLALYDDLTQNHAKPIEGRLDNTSSFHLDDEYSQTYTSKSIGPLFQAEVPVWTGFASESDSKWLGAKVWPLETDDRCNDSIKIESLCDGGIKIKPLGQGKSYSCNCPFRGSVECVRLHIAGKRLELKLELGPVFYLWRFDHMGEDVSLQWTDQEERLFKDALRVNFRLQRKCFMGVAGKCFPSKRKESLVSYYYNVFLLRRRRYQNRVMPRDIGSDDDDSEFGSFGDGLCNKITEVSSFVPCFENKECTIMDIDKANYGFFAV